MKKLLLLVLMTASLATHAQRLVLKKGVVQDSIQINDSLPESFALYLPKKFKTSESWPIVFVFDTGGNAKRALSLFVPVAEMQGYILAASNNVSDSLSISKNVLIANRMFNTVITILPIKNGRTYTAGFGSGARLASVMPTFVKGITGVLSCGSPLANTEVLSPKNPFHFIGIVGDKDFNYPDMLSLEKILNKLKFPNQLLVFDGIHEWPSVDNLSKALEYFTLAAMAKGTSTASKEIAVVTYNRNLGEVSSLMSSNKPLLADHRLSQMIRVYQSFGNGDSLKATQKSLRRSKGYRTQKRAQNAIFFKENFLKDDFDYYLEEDILTYNYNNLGWWTYQMEKLDEFAKSSNVFERNMAARLRGYINALIADNVDIIEADDRVDEEALNLLWMLKTITDPKDYTSYLKIISNNAKVSEYSTALFYLEELLKQGYTDKEKLYALEHTSLLRITPEFNEIVQKYLKEARYDIIEE